MTKFTLWHISTAPGDIGLNIGLNMGTFDTREEAEAAHPAALQDILDNISVSKEFDATRDAVRNGRFSISEDEE